MQLIVVMNDILPPPVCLIQSNEQLPTPLEMKHTVIAGILHLLSVCNWGLNFNCGALSAAQ